MANTASPFGFVQWGTVNGATPNFMSMNNPPFRIASTNTTKIGYGDPVTLISGASPTGYIDRWVNGNGSATYQLAGVFFGCRYFSVSQKKTVWNNWYPGSDASGDVEAFLCSDPNAIFMVQAGATAEDLTYVGMCADVTLGTVNTTTGWSAANLATPVGSTNTNLLPFKMISVVNAPPGVSGTDTSTGYNNVLVIPNNHIFKSLLTIHS